MEHIESLTDLHAAAQHAETAWREYARQRETAQTQIAEWQRHLARLDENSQRAYAILLAAKAELKLAESYFAAPLTDGDARAAVEAAEAAVTTCRDCQCAEDDHRFGDAYVRYAAELINDGEARRDPPNACLNCQNCGRDPMTGEGA